MNNIKLSGWCNTFKKTICPSITDEPRLCEDRIVMVVSLQFSLSFSNSKVSPQFLSLIISVLIRLPSETTPDLRIPMRILK